jgi:hypothetical protein
MAEIILIYPTQKHKKPSIKTLNLARNRTSKAEIKVINRIQE